MIGEAWLGGPIEDPYNDQALQEEDRLEENRLQGADLRGRWDCDGLSLQTALGLQEPQAYAHTARVNKRWTRMTEWKNISFRVPTYNQIGSKSE